MPAEGDPRGGSGATFALAAVAMSLFGLVGGLPLLVGPLVAVVGIVAASFWRRSPRSGPTFGPLPALGALAILAFAAPAVPSAELLGGFATVAVLLWLADDPSRPAAGGRRGAFALGSCALAVAVAGSIPLVVRSPQQEVGLAGGLLAFALLLVAYLLVRETRGRPGPTATD